MVNCYRKRVALTHSLGALSPSVYNRQKLLEDGDIYGIMAEIPDADGITLFSDLCEAIASIGQMQSPILKWPTNPQEVAILLRSKYESDPDGRNDIIEVNGREYWVSHPVRKEMLN